jgi:hypothetical protein
MSAPKTRRPMVIDMYAGRLEDIIAVLSRTYLQRRVNKWLGSHVHGKLWF